MFVALDNRKKGKKRIYTTRGAVPGPNDLFISYMSTKDIRRLEYRMGERNKAPLSIPVRMFANKWILTKGLPATKIRAFCELWSRFIAVERVVSRSNRPLEGSNADIYVVNSDKLTDCSGSCPKIVCRLKRLHKGV